MIARRRYATGVAALLFAGVGAAVTAAATPAQAATPTHVAIIVDYLGNSRVACVAWHSGMTGMDVLGTAFTVGQDPRNPGFVTQIDGNPADARHDNTHYWAYYHGSNYSTEGAAGYHPPAGSVEGWNYVDGSSSATPPPAVSYAAACGGLDPKPVPVPAPRSSSHPVTRPVLLPRTTFAPLATSAQTITTGPTSAAGSATHPASASSPVQVRPTSSGTPTTEDAATPVPSSSSSPAAGARRHTAASPNVGTAVAIAAIALLGGAAYWISRRNQFGGT